MNNKRTRPANRRHFLTSMTGLAGMAALPASGALAAAARPLYKDPAAPVAARVKDLLSRMTLEEKVAQMRCIWGAKGALEDGGGAFSAEKASKAYPHGMGMIARPSDRQGSAAPAARA